MFNRSIGITTGLSENGRKSGRPIDNFTRKTRELVEPTGESIRGEKHRPAMIYRRKA